MGHGTLTSVKRRTIIAVGAALGAVLGTMAIVALLNLTVFIEAAVPSRDALPELPPGLRIVNETEGCGSGSCYREFDIEGGPGDSSESVLSRLPSEQCSANSLVDRRPLLRGFPRGVGRGQGVRLVGQVVGLSMEDVDAGTRQVRAVRRYSVWERVSNRLWRGSPTSNPEVTAPAPRKKLASGSKSQALSGAT